MNWTYTTIMAAAVITGLALFRRMREPSDLSGWQKMAVGLGAFCGSMIGAKLPFVLADWQGFLDGTAWFDDGKTIMAGLVGGYLGAQLAEWSLDIRTRTCDNFAVPVAAAVAIGRLGCFSAGCCHGTATSLPWAVDFGDGVLRHPTQLYESAFHLSAAIVLYQMQRREILRGHLIRIYLIAYFAYRFATEFIRPEETIWFGLTGYQLAALVLMPFFAFWCCPGYRPWSKKKRPRKIGHLPQATRALCPTCLKRMPGTTFERDNRVYLRRDCSEHGMSESLVSSDRRHYYLRDEVPHPPNADEPCCSTKPGHASCVALLEVTGQCNLRCPACYAQSPNGGHRPMEELRADLDAFLAERGPLDILQLSGGEPLLHPELLQIVDHCKTLPIERIMINTNGLELLGDDTLIGELARRKPGVELYLQFDGLDTESHVALRGTDLRERKRAVLDKIIEHDLPTTLVCAVAQGVNENQLGPLLRLGLDTPQLRGITFQPVTYAGRFEPDTNGSNTALSRVTLADVVRQLVQQSEGLFTDDDFEPLPCSNPNCCSFTFVARRRGNRPLPLTRVVSVEDHLDQLADRMNFNLEDARKCCSTIGGVSSNPADFLRILIKPFMDAETYDQDRIDECCVHVIRPGGEAVSFCEFNTLLRGQRRDGPSSSCDVLLGKHPRQKVRQ